jgi:uncharacterized protein (DUF885 family)
LFSALALTFALSPASSVAVRAAQVTQSGAAELAADSLQQFAADFWVWRACYQPFTSDDIPRIEHPAGLREWSATALAKQREDLRQFEIRWKNLDSPQLPISQQPVSRQVDYRLMGSALARVRWELDLNRRWERDPTFYVDQTLGALNDALLEPPPFGSIRSRVILERLENIPAILESAKANLHAAKPFAQLAIDSLANVRAQLQSTEKELQPLLAAAPSDSPQEFAKKFALATDRAATALAGFREWLVERMPAMPGETAVGRQQYEFFLREVALLPYTPEQLLALSRQEWERAVAFEQFEKQRNQGLPELAIAATAEEQISRTARAESAIREFLGAKGILTVPASIPHYSVRAMPRYLAALSDFGELDDFASPSRTKANGIRWIDTPSQKLGYFWLATARDPRPIIVHEGVPGHFFQLVLSWSHEDPIRRRYYDSGANEGLGFYAEEMLLQAGLFDDTPRTREIIYNFMRLRALRVEVDVKLASGRFTLQQAADYLAGSVPMDVQTARQEAASFATTPGQAISYQIGKIQIMSFLADARMSQGDKFNLRAFHDFLWKNGNVPIALQHWEYLGKRDDVADPADLKH